MITSRLLTPLSLALWYMDDGNFDIRSKGLQKRTEGLTGRAVICVEDIEVGTRERLVSYLADTWGIHATSEGERRNEGCDFGIQQC